MSISLMKGGGRSFRDFMVFGFVTEKVDLVPSLQNVDFLFMELVMSQISINT